MKTLIKPVLLTSVILAGFYTSPAKACDSDPMLGSLCTFAFNFAPRGWAEANGQMLPINSNQALFSLLGTTYGGDGRTTFALPDLRGRGIISPGNSPMLSDYRWGERVGVETVTLTTAQIPIHTHTASTTIEVNAAGDGVTANALLKAASVVGDSATPSAAVFAQNIASANAYSTAPPDVALDAEIMSVSLSGSASATVSTTIISSGGQAHENRMPYQTLIWAIAMQGVFPSRS
jgi:microcystin-dependent protein